VATETTPCPLCGASPSVRLAARTAKNRQWHVAECPACQLVFTDPQPNEADIRSFYEGDYHSGLLSPGAAEKAFGEKFSDYCEWLLGYIKPGRSLDIGCSTGLLVKKLRDHGFQAEGYEANPSSANWGRTHYGITIHDGVLDPDILPAAGYDLITMCDVLEHTLNPLKYATALRRLLRPGGHVMVTFPHVWSIESLYYRTLSKLFGREWLWQTCSVPYHTWEFTPSTAQRVFEQAGFRVVAFRRRQDMQKGPIDWRSRVGLLQIPPRILWYRPLGDRFGLQMQFLLQLK
jgi:SAM-dependent methyltransferase